MNIVPIEQTVAAVITDRIIVRGKASQAQILARCATAIAYAQTLTDIADGNGAKAVTDFNGIISDPNLDPVIAMELQAVANAGLQQLAMAQQLNSFIPFFGLTLSAFFTNLAAGIASAANTLSAANQPPAGGQK